MGNTRMYTALRDYGDRLDTVGVFSFKVNETGEIYEGGLSIATMLPYINKWTHIKWLLTIGNDGTSSIFTALRNNTKGAQDKFLSELIRIMKENPWCSGVDIDLERGGEYENRDKANTLFKRIYETVKAYDSANHLSGQRQNGTPFCPCCGVEIPQTPHRKPKKYCSDTCRMRWWREHPTAINRKSAVLVTCRYCGGEFSDYQNAGRKYCSHECYIADRFGGGKNDKKTNGR